MVHYAIYGFTLHLIVVDVCLLGFVTKNNPFSRLKFIIPAQIKAFGSASSAVTMLVTLKYQAIRSGPRCHLPLCYNLGATDLHPLLLHLVGNCWIGWCGSRPVGFHVLLITAYNFMFNITGTPLDCRSSWQSIGS
jgi:hypothetical protein